MCDAFEPKKTTVIPGSHVWSRSFGGSIQHIAYHAAVDASGQIALAGHFHGAIDFGDRPLGGRSGGCAFLAQFDAAGNLRGSRAIGDGRLQAVHAVMFDRAGDILILGELRSPAGTAGQAFVAKLDASGAPIWTTRLPVACQALTTDSTGSVLLAGHFSGAVSIGWRTLTSASTEDVVVWKLDRDGNGVDFAQLSSSPSQRAHRMLVTPDDHVILTGYFARALDPGGEPLEGEEAWEMFVTRFDASGHQLWRRRLDTASLMRGHGAACDPAGNLLLAGSLKRNPELRADDLATGTAVFLVKVDAQSKVVYSKTLSATAMEFRQGLAVDAHGNAAVTGHVREHGHEAWTMFVTTFDPSGRMMWSRRFDGTNGHFLQRIGMDASGAVLLTGAFQGAIDFGGGPLKSGPKEAIFLVKLAGPNAGPGRRHPRSPCVRAEQ